MTSAADKLRGAVGSFMLKDGRTVLVHPGMEADDMWAVLKWALGENEWLREHAAPYRKRPEVIPL